MPSMPTSAYAASSTIRQPAFAASSASRPAQHGRHLRAGGVVIVRREIDQLGAVARRSQIRKSLFKFINVQSVRAGRDGHEPRAMRPECPQRAGERRVLCDDDIAGIDERGTDDVQRLRCSSGDNNPIGQRFDAVQPRDPLRNLLAQNDIAHRGAVLQRRNALIQKHGARRLIELLKRQRLRIGHARAKANRSLRRRPDTAPRVLESAASRQQTIEIVCVQFPDPPETAYPLPRSSMMFLEFKADKALTSTAP